MSEFIARSRSFMPLWISHFLSAVNTNFIRTVFLFFITYHMTQDRPIWFGCSVLLYALAFGASSAIWGQWADRFSLKKLLLYTRACEAILMFMAWGCIAINSRIAFFCLIPLFGAVGAGLRILDYTLIPALVPRKQLNKGNAWLKMMTMLALGIATLFMTSVLKTNLQFSDIFSVGVVLSVLAFATTLPLPSLPDIDKDKPMIWSFQAGVAALQNTIKNQYELKRYLIGIAWFWLVTVIIALFSPDYGTMILHVRWSVIMFLTVLFAFAFSAGAFYYLIRVKQDQAGSYSALSCLVFGGILCVLALISYHFHPLPLMRPLTVSQFLFSHTCVGYWVITLGICALGALTAGYLIPFYTLLQINAPAKKLGSVLALGNMMNALFVLGAFAMILLLKLLFFKVLAILIILSVCIMAMSVYMIPLMPFAKQQGFWRCVLQRLFRAKIKDIENLDAITGRGLIITNHTSYLDALLICAFSKRKITFAVNEKWMQSRTIRILLSLADVRPLDSANPLTIKDMVTELKQDKLCMVFTHGLVDDGNTRLKIYEGAAMMAYKADAPLIPIQIRGAKHTLFSRLLKKNADFRWFPKITLTVLPPVKLVVDDNLPIRQKREKISLQLYDIVNTMAFAAHDTSISLFEAAVRCMKCTGRLNPVFEDVKGKAVKIGMAFVKAFALGQIIKPFIKDGPFVGLMLPTSSTCSLTVMALHTLNKVPAMINFSASQTQVLSTCQTVGLKKIITAHKVVELAKLTDLIAFLQGQGIQILYLEDMAKTATLKHKIYGLFGGLFPRMMYKKTAGGRVAPNDTALILFTSGSEGFPKAVFLTHKNVVSNCIQVLYRVDIGHKDILLCCLPMFHSFGMLAGCFAPLVLGLKSVLYPTPLHYRIIPEVCAAVRATIFLGTNTFLMGYARCANPYDFNSLRLVVAGAERLQPETRQIWMDKFGLRVLEGYGATECSPILALNTMIQQRQGSVGRLFPGMQARLKPVDGIKDGQELSVAGPNIMQGYMRHTKPQELDPPAQGWYDTGDIVEIDADGFVFIKGRSKRFAKIGGEMVSLQSVEDIILKKFKEIRCGAVSIPDSKKGEKIVVITNDASLTKEKLIDAFKAAGAPEISIPAQVMITDDIPVLSSGKFDYQKAKKMAMERG